MTTDIEKLIERLRGWPWTAALHNAAHEREVMVKDAADALEAQAAEIERLRDRLEKIEAQATEGVVWGWVCIPAVEWEAITSDTRTEKEIEDE